MSFKKAEGRANYDLNYAGTETASPTAVRYWNLQAQQLAGGCRSYNECRCKNNIFCKILFKRGSSEHGDTSIGARG